MADDSAPLDADQQLVKRVQQGDKKAFDLLVLKYQHRIAGLVSRFIYDSAEVQDVTQEAFIKAYRALPNFRGDSQFYTWLYRIAINTAKNFLMARKRRPPSGDVDIDDAMYFEEQHSLKDVASPEKNLMSEQLMEVITNAIKLLPEDLRTALTLREYDDLSYEEIAEVMDCPIGTVRSRIFRAREMVDEKIKPLMNEQGF
jgi:RNA polymerase sigma-70 factor (ECF subfamily)